MSDRLRQGGAAAAVVLAVWVIYGPLLRADPLLARDDQRLVGALEPLSSLGQYSAAIRAGEIRDIQPVRDLSFAIDLAVQHRTGVHPFHATNALLWLAIVATCYALFLAVTGRPTLALALALIFAVHPVFVGSVAWVAARKHLLSCLFILLATLQTLRGKAQGFGVPRKLAIALLYGASIFSQPITVLWPLWMLGSIWPAAHLRRSALTVAALCLPLMVGCAAVNVWYYTGPFVAQAGAEKFVPASGTAGVALLAWGRSFINCILPIRLATSYDPGSWLNMVGLLLLPAFAYLCLKRLPREQALIWLGFFTFPLLVVATKMTTIFVSDPYLLTPAVGLFCLMGLLVEPSIGRSPRGWALIAGLLATVFGLVSWQLAKSWSSDADLWAHAYAIEPTPNAMAKQAFYLTQTGRAEEALQVAERLAMVAPRHPELSYVFARAVFLDPQLTLTEKLGALEAHPSSDPWHAYYLGWLLMQQGDAPGAFHQLQRALQQPRAFKRELPLVAADGAFLCDAAGGQGCAALADALRSSPSWNESLFRGRAEDLRRSGGSAAIPPAPDAP